MTTKAHETLAAAFKDRAEVADRDAQYAADAPALFKAEWVERAEREFAAAVEARRYWSSVGAS